MSSFKVEVLPLVNNNLERKYEPAIELMMIPEESLVWKKI